jgi:hypothetical protein
MHYLPVPHMLKYITHLLLRYQNWSRFNPPCALSSTGWKSFNDEFKMKAPLRYWWHNDYKRLVVYPITRKYRSISDWIIYRTVERNHILKTGLKPGYADNSEVMLHVNFGILKRYVEHSVAIRETWNLPEYNKALWCYRNIPLYRKFKPFCSPELGIKYLEWCTTLDDPALPPHERSDRQAAYARETLSLYEWWTKDRPARTAIEVTDFFKDKDDDFWGNHAVYATDPGYILYMDSIKASNDQAANWDIEDDRMLSRLMMIRRSLWI